MIYCVVPRELEGKLRGKFGRALLDAGLDPVVEWRVTDRRRAERRGADVAVAAERRVTRGPSGRRVAERRAVAVPVAAPPLGRAAERHARRLAFYACAVPAPDYVEDAEAARLVLRVQLGDRAALRDLYLGWFDRVHAFCRVALDGPHAEDATQDALETACRALTTVDPVATPLRVVLFEHALATIRLREALPAAADDEPRLPSWDESGAAAVRSALGWVRDHELAFLVGRLPAAQREVMLLRHLGHLSEAQAAAVLDLDAETQRALHADAVDRLCETLEALGRGAPSTQREAMRRLSRPSTVLVQRRRALLAG